MNSLDRLVLAGQAEADELQALWLPNLVDAESRPDQPAETPYDVVFFGSLSYEPNVEALAWLDAADTDWSGLRMLVAGRRPAPAVRSLCEANGWALVEDFPSTYWLRSQATVAISPLQSASGIQNKVLEAAAVGLAQVVSPQALAGIGGDLPCLVARTPNAMVDSVRELLDDDAERSRLADRAWRFVRDNYSVDRWLPVFERLIERQATGHIAASDRERHSGVG